MSLIAQLAEDRERLLERDAVTRRAMHRLGALYGETLYRLGRAQLRVVEHAQTVRELAGLLELVVEHGLSERSRKEIQTTLLHLACMPMEGDAAEAHSQGKTR